MITYWSATTKGFYNSDIHGTNIPSDSVEITDELRLSLIEGQYANNKRIVAGPDGQPILVDPPADEITADLTKSIRVKRNNLLSSSDWTQLGDIPPGIKAQWSEYRQLLRDVPQQSGFPTSIVWPSTPA